MRLKHTSLRLAGAAMIAAAVVPWLGGGTAGADATSSDCPAGTTAVAKYEWKGSSYVAEFGADKVTVTGDTTSGTFSSTVPISDVFVKGATDGKTDHYDPAVTSGTFTSSGLSTKSGETPAISHVTFCTPSSTSSSPPPTTTSAPVTTSAPPTTTSAPPTTSSAPVTSATSVAATTASQAVSVLPTKVENTTAEEEASPETSVLGEAESLPKTGGGIPFTALVVISLGLLLAGGSLLLLPGLGVERGNRRH
jgi:hypothetical protein